MNKDEKELDRLRRAAKFHENYLNPQPSPKEDWREYLVCHWGEICSNEYTLCSFIKSLLSEQKKEIKEKAVIALDQIILGFSEEKRGILLNIRDYINNL